MQHSQPAQLPNLKAPSHKNEQHTLKPIKREGSQVKQQQQQQQQQQQ